MKGTGPYSVGFNGHAKCCNCKACSKDRAYNLVARVREHEVRPPADDATIFVRAHFRRGKYLTKTPGTLRIYQRLLRAEFKGVPRG